MSELAGTKMLIAEDDEGILSLLRTFFESQGAEVFTEEHGRDMVVRADEIQPDIILLDVVMPYVDGLTVLANLRAAGNQIPVIMLTDKNTVDDKVKGLDYGADDYVAKPFSTRELLSRVKSVLRRSDVSAQNSIVSEMPLGNIVIKPLAREITVGESDSLKLTKTEFDLLLYLAERKACVASHVELLNNVLGYKNPVETKALVMHVANIRKKMAKAQVEGVRVETVAGVGYMFKEI
jgi:DNA-binding response OmpR family regulator